MSVIQRIRDKGAWIVFAIIALALIAFILQDGVGRGGSGASSATTIGKVNGEKIERADFEEKLALQERMYGAQGAKREQLIGSLWNQEVERVVLNQEYQKLGLRVSSRELSDILFGENSPLRQEFTDPKTGEFRANDARQAFAELKKSKNAEQIKTINSVYITPTIEQTLRNKYQNLLIQAAYIPKWLLDKQQADNNAVASFSYVYVPYAAVNDSAVKVSDDEIKSYVSKHAKEYAKEEETRNFSYISFSAAPSTADSANALNLVSELKAEFAATSDAQAFLTKAGSEVPYYNSYFSKARMQLANKDSLTKTPVGGLFGPYTDANNYVIAKMVGTKQWPDSVRVRHILIATADPRSGQEIRPDSIGKKLIDSIELAVKGGADFAALVSKYSDDPGSKEKGGVYEYFPQGQMVVPFNDFAFDKAVGTRGVVKADYGYHFVEILGQKNPNTVYKIAYLAKPILASNETVTAASTAAAQFALAGKNAKAFTALALKENRQILNATDIKQNDFTIPSLGPGRLLVRWVYEHGKGDVSEPIEIGENYIVALVSAVNKPGVLSVEEARPTVEAIVRNEKKAQQIIETKFKGNTLEALATSTGTPVVRADSLSFSAPFIASVGNEPKVIGAAFNKASLGKASGPIAGSTGVFAIKTESNGAKAATTDATTVKQNLVQTARMSSYRGLEALKKAARVKDSRSKFY
ncbi:MAG: peptidylprolyl isomerase [Sediminibacterium sp.]|nr:peptidylprolyl isomerase [Sediminibacterium sp.]MDP3128893.1 peptidylprolyl isomerase [Sediminibacterium sp.]